MADDEEGRHPYAKLFLEVQSILFDEDHVGLNYGENVDEYRPEVGTLLHLLGGATGPSDVAHLVYLEMVRRFDAKLAGPEARYARIVSERGAHGTRPCRATRSAANC